MAQNCKELPKRLIFIPFNSVVLTRILLLILSEQFNLWKQADPFTAVTTALRHSQRQKATRFTSRHTLVSRMEQLCLLTARSVPWSSLPRQNFKITWIFTMESGLTSALSVTRNSALLSICKITSGFTLMCPPVTGVKRMAITFKDQMT